MNNIIRNILLSIFVFFANAGTSCVFAGDDFFGPTVSRDEAIRSALDGVEQVSEVQTPAGVSSNFRQMANPREGGSPDPDIKVKISGAIRAAFGVESNGDMFFTRANANLNEKNYRLLSSDQLNNRQNTYDPGIYSRLKVIVDASVRDAVDMHLNVTVDPWSYTGKTAKQTVTSTWGDTAEVQHLFWGNNGYTYNHLVNTFRYGGWLGIPEIKPHGGVVPATTAASSICNEWGQCDTFDMPEAKIDYTFQPIRELWFDFKPGDTGKVRVFPMGYQDQALTTDDPLRLSNNKMWWEESPWLWDWAPGQVNTGATPVDFTIGTWYRDFSFSTRDSDGVRLTALRGVAIDLKPTEDMTVQGVIASPKTLWQEYSEVRSVPGSLRVKQAVGDQMYVGGTANMHTGLVEGKVDKENYVQSVDAGIVPVEGVKVLAQVSASESRNDWRDEVYRSKARGNAYYLSVEAISDAIDPLKTDYMAQQPRGSETFAKTKLFFGRMDENFESSLSNYHETRDDAFWSRHLTFYPSLYRHMPGVTANQSEADQEAFAIGNGLDYGRNVFGWRADTVLLDAKLEGMGDVRHVTTNEGKTVETVARTEWTHKTTDKLTTKALLLWQGMPKTREDEDPYITDGDTGLPLINTAVEGGLDRDLKTSTLGARYELTDWADINGVWEYTNDVTVGADQFPRGLFDGSTAQTYMYNGRVYRRSVSYLYDQGFFDQPPYEYRNIFKGGLHLKPTDIWDLYFDYTRNPNRFAGNIDDNMDHVGVETSFVPNKHLGFFARYTLSRGYDLNRLNKDKELEYRNYHNLFLEGRYIAPRDNSFSLQYGVGPAFLVDTSSTDPALAYYAAPVLSTEHVIRLIYEKKF